MGKILIVYGTHDGHTRKIAETVAECVAGFGHTPFLADAAVRPRLGDTGAWNGVIVCAPIRVGKHPASVVAFVRENVARLNHLPTAFFSVSLTAAGKDVSGAKACADTFLAQTGWRPGMVRLVAGALLYTRYNWLLKRIMRRISRKSGGDTDITRDFDYTDWQALREDVEAFVIGAVAAACEVDRRLARV